MLSNTLALFVFLLLVFGGLCTTIKQLALNPIILNPIALKSDTYKPAFPELPSELLFLERELEPVHNGRIMIDTISIQLADRCEGKAYSVNEKTGHIAGPYGYNEVKSLSKKEIRRKVLEEEKTVRAFREENMVALEVLTNSGLLKRWMRRNDTK
ncbi:hypothetical protein BZA77DRAFT_296567 [Pyronema omphalodes]|nr:hypothetical protein BZA77DRAFT_296567 [Pyronema omphalodes]